MTNTTNKPTADDIYCSTFSDTPSSYSDPKRDEIVTTYLNAVETSSDQFLAMVPNELAHLIKATIVSPHSHLDSVAATLDKFPFAKAGLGVLFAMGVISLRKDTHAGKSSNLTNELFMRGLGAKIIHNVILQLVCTSLAPSVLTSIAIVVPAELRKLGTNIMETNNGVLSDTESNSGPAITKSMVLNGGEEEYKDKITALLVSILLYYIELQDVYEAWHKQQQEEVNTSGKFEA